MKRMFLALALLLLAGQAHAAALDDCHDQIPYGAPTVLVPTDVVCHTAYLSFVDPLAKMPRLVAWVETGEHALGCLPRPNAFAADLALPADARALPSDYLDSHHDKGHLASDADMAWAKAVLIESFLMSNMTPQVHGFNAGIWLVTERDARMWSLQFGELVETAGPIILPGAKTIGRGIPVPAGFWKVIYSPGKKAALAFLFPDQTQVVRGSDLASWRVPVAAVEHAAGVTVPLPEDTDRDHVADLWPIDSQGWAAAKKKACPAIR